MRPLNARCSGRFWTRVHSCELCVPRACELRFPRMCIHYTPCAENSPLYRILLLTMDKSLG